MEQQGRDDHEGLVIDDSMSDMMHFLEEPHR